MSSFRKSSITYDLTYDAVFVYFATEETNMPRRITASEARAMSGRHLDDKIDALLAAVERVAREGKRELKTGWQHKEDPDLWVEGGYSTTSDWNAAKEELQKLGYAVTFFYEEKQFVDMYTIISW